MDIILIMQDVDHDIYIILIMHDVDHDIYICHHLPAMIDADADPDDDDDDDDDLGGDVDRGCEARHSAHHPPQDLS